MNISLTRLPWYAQIGAFVALAVAANVGFYRYYEAPMKADIAGREAQLASIRADINKGLETARKLDEFKRVVDDLETRLVGLRAVLPEEKDAADLLRRMESVATQSSLTIKSFKPAPVVLKQVHAEWPISLELDGTYHNLAMFFDRVGKFTRIVNISGLDIKGKDKPDPNATISASCLATTFVLLDKETIAKQAKKAAGAKPAAREKPAD